MTEGREPPPGEEPSLAPPEPATPPSPILSATPSSFEPPSEPDRAVRRLRFGSVLARTFDTYLTQPIGFGILAVPAALGSLLTIPFAGAPDSSPTFWVVTIVVFIMSFVFSLATIVAADDVQAGRPFDLGSSVSRALGRSVSGILSAIAFGLALLGLLFGIGVVVILLFAVSPALAAIGLVAVYVILLYVVLRWIFSLPAIALDGVGPIEALRVSWRITKGSVLRLIALFIVLGLIFLPISLGAAFLSIAGGNDIVSLVIPTVGAVIAGPIGGIALAVMYGDLTGRPMLPEPTAVARQRRWILVGLIVALGVIGIVVAGPRLGSAFDRLALRSVPIEARGKILAGVTRSDRDKCTVTGTKTTFASSDTIYLGGYFTRTIPRGQSATVTVYVNGNVANTVPITSATNAIGCYYEEQPLVNAAPATYKLIVTLNAEVIAQGEFVVD